MADEKKDEKNESRDAKGEGARRSSGMKPVILVCLGVFLAAAAGFAWMDGLFSKTPLPVVEATDATKDSTVTLHATAAGEAPAQETLAESAKTPQYNTLAQLQNAPEPPASAAEASRETEEWIAQEKADLKRKQTELDVKSRELEKLKTEIEQLLARVQETKSERIVMMAKLYDSMDPEAVARQISSMDDRTVVMLLPQMNTRTAAKVMAAIDPKRAAQITTKMLALEP